MGYAFEVRGAVASPRAPAIVHVPHSGTHIPPEIRNQFVLDDENLQQEIVRLTDWHVDELFDGMVELGGVVFVNRLSRLVVDPERFVDDAREEMAVKGMGALYTRTTEGMTLRCDGFSSADRERLLSEYFMPYAEAFEQLTAKMLDHFGRVGNLSPWRPNAPPSPENVKIAPTRRQGQRAGTRLLLAIAIVEGTILVSRFAMLVNHQSCGKSWSNCLAERRCR